MNALRCQKQVWVHFSFDTFLGKHSLSAGREKLHTSSLTGFTFSIDSFPWTILLQGLIQYCPIPVCCLLSFVSASWSGFCVCVCVCHCVCVCVTVCVCVCVWLSGPLVLHSITHIPDDCFVLFSSLQNEPDIRDFFGPDWWVVPDREKGNNHNHHCSWREAAWPSAGSQNKTGTCPGKAKFWSTLSCIQEV